MTAPVRWGILGAGAISHRFVSDLKQVAGAQAVAVGARSAERAAAFAAQFGIARSHGSYEELAAEPQVDCIYIGTPHNFHQAHTLLCLEHDKHVVCEKPFAINAEQARRMIARARERKLFLMEAMWSRFNPVYVRARQWIASGLIGEVRMLKADFGFAAARKPEGRLFNPKLGGGSLLDVGIYPLSLASHLFGPRPSAIQAVGRLGPTGVDEQAAIVLQYPEDQLALLSCAIRTRTAQNALIIGTAGKVWLPAFWRARLAVLRRPKQAPRITWGKAGYRFEAAEAVQCIRAGRTESSTMPLDESLAIMETMDRIRQRIGLKYPGE
ncbi:MAG TPA: Gfo/Idh/MocA family oxidoreductase [Verrucomicrobiota bacterium]|nr:Gfo/Idh/MocA family oxidoreductase [Verrucomicrobiota bacterium]HQL79553.1 Gfo/Idh/MocA family oxidoreductase [Verrucomicrobiota bacterium]